MASEVCVCLSIRAMNSWTERSAATSAMLRSLTWSSTASSAVSWISNTRCAYSENEAAVRSALALASASTLRQLHHANSVKIRSGTKNCDRNRRKSPARAGDDNWLWISTAAQIAIKAATVGSATELKGRTEEISTARRWPA